MKKPFTLTYRALVRVLWTSLMLNVFLLASIGVYWAGLHDRPPHVRGLSVDNLEKRFILRLPPQDAQVFKQVLEAHRSELASRMEALRQAREAVVQVLESEPMDRDRLGAALDRNRDAWGAVQSAVKAIVLDAEPRLSHEGRTHLYERD